MLSGSDDLAPGVTFGGYVVHELIGRGGMASVYRAEHLLLEKPVALKVMDRSLLASSIGLSRFLREGRVAAAIKHPNVVDINDVGVHDGVPYLVMELLRGEDLDRHLRKHGPLDTPATVRLALPVIAALHAAHTSGVVHRDIKPSNIFLSLGPDEQVVPKVLDFGISKMSLDRAALERAATPQNQIIGTPQYLPPEALQGVAEIGPASDQYSLGVVLYQCVTGRTPFGGDTLLALLESLSRGTFEPPRALAPSVPPELERVILRALSASPGDRFPSIRDMGRALIELAAQRTQVVWRQSFATPAHGHSASTGSGFDVPSSLDSSARRRSSELSLTHTSAFRPPRFRRAALGAGLVLAGGLAAALWSALVARPGVAESAAGRAPNALSAGAPLPSTTGHAEPAPAAAAPGATTTRHVLGLTPAPALDGAPPLEQKRASQGALAAPRLTDERDAERSSSAANAREKAGTRAARVRKASSGAKARRAATSNRAEQRGSARARSTESAEAEDSAQESALAGERSAPSARSEPVETPEAPERADPSASERDAPGAIQPAREGSVLRGANGAPLLD